MTIKRFLRQPNGKMEPVWIGPEPQIHGGIPSGNNGDERPHPSPHNSLDITLINPILSQQHQSYTIMNRTGKIARLPRSLRDELNRRLEHNIPGRTLVAWLNSL